MTIATAHVVDQLRRAGLRPSARQWQVLREAGRLALPALLDLALETDKLAGPEPAAFGPLHALRMLGEFPPPEPAVVDRLLAAVPIPSGPAGAQAPFLWLQDLPQIVARWGRVAFERARLILADEAAPPARRGAAAVTLGHTVVVEPELRDEVVAVLRERLRDESDPYVMGFAVDTLGNLHAADAYAEVIAAYRRGAVDRDIVVAAEVRQRLLRTGPIERHACVMHPLEERYDQHGPFTDEQRRMMSEQSRGQG